MTLRPITFSSKRFMLACILGLAMAFASTGYAQDVEGEPAPAAVVEEGAVSAPETAPVPAPVAETPVAEAPAEMPAAEIPTEEAVVAEPEAEETALSKLSAEILNILIPAFLLLIGFLVTWILNKVRAKLHLDVSDKQIASWADIANKAALRGSEWARNKAKDLTDDKTIPGPEVLEVAVDWAVEMGRAFKLPEIGREKLVGLIEGHLNTDRFEKAMASNAHGVAIPQ
jgi:hypothetical protein